MCAQAQARARAQGTECNQVIHTWHRKTCKHKSSRSLTILHNKRKGFRAALIAAAVVAAAAIFVAVVFVAVIVNAVIFVAVTSLL